MPTNVAMSDSPAVSVVAGAYNAQRYLPEMIESILEQTFRDFEFILVDDGSTDRTAQIISEYASKDARIRPIRIPHGGIVDAANTGLNAARAELIARADSDDVALPQRFERQVRYLAEHPECVCVGSRMLLIEPFGSPMGESVHKLTHEAIDAELLRGSGWAMPQPVAMMRKWAVEKVGGYRNEYLWSEDLDLFLRLSEVGRLANLPEALVKYRNHPGSTNHRRAKLQQELSQKCVIETYHRRGLSVPTDLNMMSGDGRPADRYLNWAWAALRAQNVRGARRHAFAALRLEPFSLHAWKATYCAIRGR
jgi:glycosyltransferase involved in cell wall biosynthesis